MTATSEHPAGATTHRSGFLRVVGWAFTMDGGGQLLTLVISFVLAGLLGPRTYGVVAMAMVYVAFVQMVQRQGMAAAIIQRKELTGRHLDTAFWLVLSVSGILTAASILLAGWWAGVNGLPELRPIITALSALVVVEALTTVQVALLTRRMHFRALAARRLFGVVSGGAVGLTGALIGWGAWAIVGQQLVTAVVSLIVLWLASGWRPRLRFSAGAARDLLGFSSGSLLSSVAVFANNRADVLLVGLFFGPVVVGIYQLAARLIDTVVMVASKPVQTVGLPELSPHQDDSVEFARRLRRLMRVSAVVAVPALGVVTACAIPLVELLGAEWSAAAAVVQVLCVVGLVRVIIVLDGPLLQALGRPFVQAGLSWLAAAVSIATFVTAGVLLQDVASDEQALFIAVARAGIYGVLLVAIHMAVVRRYTVLPWTGALSVYATPVIAALLGAVAGTSVPYLASGLTPLVTLILAGLVSVSVITTLMVAFQRDLRSLLTWAVRRGPTRGDSVAPPVSRGRHRRGARV